MSLALGLVVRLHTRYLCAIQNSVTNLDQCVRLPEAAVRELLFWINSFHQTVDQPIWSSSPRIDVLSSSDASQSGWAGYTVLVGDRIARGNWSTQDIRESSTFRELKAVRLVLESFAHSLANLECKHRTDNQNTCSIMCLRSNKPNFKHRLSGFFPFVDPELFGCILNGFHAHSPARQTPGLRSWTLMTGC